MTSEPSLPTYHELRQRLDEAQQEIARAAQIARDSEVRRVAQEGELERLRERVEELERQAEELQRRAGNERADADATRRELAAAYRDVQRARQLAAQRQREVDQALNVAIVALGSVREDIDRIEASSAWRLGHAAARTASRVRMRRLRTQGAVARARERVDKVTEVLAARKGDAPGAVAAGAPVRRPRPERELVESLATRIRDRLGPTPERTEWPGVSVLVLNRNGEALLGPLLAGLRETDYPQLELVVVDHASEDDSVGLLRAAHVPFPVRVRREQANRPFATSLNDAARLAMHPLLLLLDNDTEPFERGWLKELVDGMLASGCAALGATLLGTEQPEGPQAPPSGFEVQQRGIALARSGSLPRTRMIDSGVDLFGERFGIEYPVAAASGSCLLLRRDAFERAGGLESGYRYGLEDVDLCFSVAAAGERVLCSGRAVLFHEGGATLATVPGGPDANRRFNERRLAERWGPALRHELRERLLARDPGWVGDQVIHAAIVRGDGEPEAPVDRLGAALQRLGWSIQEGVGESLDVAIIAAPGAEPPSQGSITSVAWIREHADAWLGGEGLDNYDIVLAATPEIAADVRERTGREAVLFAPAVEPRLEPDVDRELLAGGTYDERARRLRELVAASDQRLSFCVKIGAQDWDAAPRWGDLYLARDLLRALRRRGHRGLIQVQEEWDNDAGLAYDVALHLRGRTPYAPRPGQFNILWVISHPEEVSVEEADSSDLVCVASELFASELSERISTPVITLEQATDPWRFYPDPDPSLAHDLVFVGNSRGVHRRILEDLLPTDHDLAVWGSGLEQSLGEHRVQGEWFANEELRRLYSSAKVVLCDHWEGMREHGFASNRLYDAVASGAVVLSDSVAGLDERFGEAVLTYSTADELHGLVQRLLSSDEERARRTAGARERLIERHTFDQRAGALIEAVAEHAPRSGHRARIASA